jgi:hypothetical protein
VKWVLRFLWMMWARQTGRRALNKAKAKGVLVYLKTVSVTRKTVIVVLLATVAIHIFLMATVGLIVTSVLLFKPDSVSALEILFFGFAGTVGLFLLATGYLLSQGLWYRFSGAQKLVQDIEKEAA